jgi:hypothetical protein
MILRAVMERLTAQAMPPLRLVQGLAEFEALQAPPGDASMPAAYVVPLAMTAQPNNLAAGGFRQPLEESFAVILLHRNKRDSRGQEAALDLVDHVIPAMRRALFGWQPGPAWTQIEIRQGRLIDSTNGVLAWREDYVTATQMRL